MSHPYEPSHPDGRPLSDFERALWRLKIVSHEATCAICSVIVAEDRKRDRNLLFTVTNHGLIIVCKFLEIWDVFNRMGVDNRRIREVTVAAAPAVRAICLPPEVVSTRYKLFGLPQAF